jgi:hypothetical protein
MRILLSIGVLAGLCLGLPMTLVSGAVDTVGGTTFDNQNSGPSLQMIAFDPEYGIHVAWTYSAQASTWPDRTMRYNFYDLGASGWNWVDTSGFMGSGLDSQFRRTGYGTLDISPSDGAAIIGCHYNTGGMPPSFAGTLTRDLAPGVGSFNECNGAPTLTGYFLPVVGSGPDGTLHYLLIRFEESDNLYYSRSTFWCDWEDPVGWSQIGAYGHNLAASKQSDKVLATWMTGNDDSTKLLYRVSTNAGASWDQVEALQPPTAFGPDTATVPARGSGLLFDRDDNWWLATTVLPAVGDSAYQNPAQVWLYNSVLSEWHRIHRAQAGTLAGGFGSHAAICDRPSIGQNPATGRLYATWEQFDSLNVEDSTGLLRADIWLSWSDDGSTWGEPVRLTEPDQSSKRFPNLARICAGDTLAVVFIQDVIAGFNVDEVGAVSDNPVCVWHGQAVGIEEQPGQTLNHLSVAPNPGARFNVNIGTGDETAVDILDAAGRLVRRGRGTGIFAWDGRDAAGQEVRPGCYLLRWQSGGRTGQAKLVVAR